jgi:hypothetical protein
LVNILLHVTTVVKELRSKMFDQHPGYSKAVFLKQTRIIIVSIYKYTVYINYCYWRPLISLDVHDQLLLNMFEVYVTVFNQQTLPSYSCKSLTLLLYCPCILHYYDSVCSLLWIESLNSDGQVFNNNNWIILDHYSKRNIGILIIIPALNITTISEI